MTAKLKHKELSRRAPQLTADEFLKSPYVLVGTVEQLVEQVIVRRQRWGISYYTVREPDLEAFAPVVARLTGT